MVNIIVEPFEPIVQKAVDFVEKSTPGYFSSIKKIILESGDPGHFGKVESDKTDTIFLSLNKIKGVLTGKDEELIVRQVADVLVHEMGHLKSKFTGGESPAEAEQRLMADKLSKTEASLNKQIRAARYVKNIKLAQEIREDDPTALAQSIISVIRAFTGKVKPENRIKYLNSMKANIRKSINPTALSVKKRNPGAGVGSTVSVIKNILAGLPSDTILRVVNLVIAGL